MRLKRVILMLMAGLLLAGGATFISTATAEATAFGCTGYGPGVTYKGVRVVNGTFCGNINGTGTWVNTFSGNAYDHIPSSNYCNWEMKADFYDASGRWRDWASTGIRYGCTPFPDATVNVHRSEPRGKVRITFRSNGRDIAAVEHAIF